MLTTHKAIETRYKGYRFRSHIPLKTPGKRISKRADIAGKVFGRLTVVEDLGPDNRGWRFWGCACSCGELIVVNSRELKRGHTQSCGCLFRENLRKKSGWNRLPHGQSAFNQLFGLYKKSAKERGYTFLLTADEFRFLTEQACHYCGALPEIKFRAASGTNGNYYGNGVDRIDNTSGYEPGNVVPCCTQCNIAKGVLTVEAFKEWAMRLSARFEHGESGAK